MYGNPTMINEDHDNPKNLENHLSEIPIDFSSASSRWKAIWNNVKKQLLEETLKHYDSSYKAAAVLKQGSIHDCTETKEI